MLFDHVATSHHAAAVAGFDKLALRHIVPRPFRKPHVDLRLLRYLVHGIRHRRREDVIAEHISVRDGVGSFSFRPIVVHWTAHRHSRVVRLACGGVDVRPKAVPHAERLAQRQEVVSEFPNAALEPPVLRRVRPEYRSEHAGLHPARVEFAVRAVFALRLHVPAKVVSPVAVADVRRRRCKPRYRLQHSPRHLAVAGEPDLVTVRTKSAPAVVDNRTLFAAPTACVVRGEEVVQPERVAQGRHPLRHEPLLPVEPEEVRAVRFQRLDDVLEEHLGPALLLRTERDGVRALPTVVARKASEALLHRRDAACRMDVERSLQPVVVQEAERSLRVREVPSVPRVAAPADALPRLVAKIRPVADVPRLVPVHLDHAHVHRYAETVHRPHDFAVVGVRVRPETAPPIPKRPARWKRNAPRDAHVVAEATLVVVAIGEYDNVPVRVFPAFWPFRDPLFPVFSAIHEQRRRSVVHDGYAATREQSLLHARQKVLDVAASVNRAHRAEKVFRVRRKRGDAVHDEVVFVERPSRPFQPHPVGLDCRAIALARQRMLDWRHGTIDECDARTVFELPVLAPFAANHPVGQEREPRLAYNLRIANGGHTRRCVCQNGNRRRNCEHRNSVE